MYNKRMENPKLRQLEVVPYDDNNAVIRDPSGISSKMLLVSRDVLFICSLCDGRTAIPAIQEEWEKVFEGPLERGRIEEIIRQLDECFFLENSKFSREKYRIEQEFLNSQVRKPFHAGTGYSDDPRELKKYLDEEFGRQPHPRTAPPKAIIAPHIDITRGISCYAEIYNQLRTIASVDLVIILGVSHAMTQRSIILTGKDFQTPFGIVRTDEALVEGLRGRLQFDFFADEILHRNEHSVEFQVLLLQYVFAESLSAGKEFTILPLLCSECGNLQEEAAEFTDALKQCISDEKRSPLFIAGADLSHLGRRFGQDVEISRDYLRWAEEKDRKMLASVCSGNPEEFLRGIQEESNNRNVCGVPAIYTLLKLAEPGSSELVCYNQAVDRETSSLVSYAGITFF